MKPNNGQRTARYFQFPLCALAYGGDSDERLNAILDYAVVEAGRVLWGRYPSDQRSKLLATWRLATKLPNDIRLDLPTHHEALAGAEVIGLIYSSFADVFKRHAALARFVSDLKARHGPSPLVRIRRDLFFEARDRKGVSYPELAVLAGLYSVIGRKPKPVRITQATIRHRALGYKSPAVQQAELSRRTDGAQPLTEWQLRSTLDRLHERGFFGRSTYARRLTYYSHRMKDKAVRSAVIERKSRSALFQLNRRLSDQEATDQIRNLRALAAGKPPPKPDLRGNTTADEALSWEAPPPLR